MSKLFIYLINRLWELVMQVTVSGSFTLDLDFHQYCISCFAQLKMDMSNSSRRLQRTYVQVKNNHFPQGCRRLSCRSGAVRLTLRLLFFIYTCCAVYVVQLWDILYCSKRHKCSLMWARFISSQGRFSFILTFSVVWMIKCFLWVSRACCWNKKQMNIQSFSL